MFATISIVNPKSIIKRCNIQRITNLLIAIFVGYSFYSCQNGVDVTSSSIEGEWRCTEQHYETGKQNYVINIEYSNSENTEIKLMNFNNIGGFCKASVSGTSITVPKQVVNEHEIFGSGTISSDYSRITFNYTDDLYGDGGGKVSSSLIRYE